MPKAIEHAHEAILATTRTMLAQEGYDSLTMRSIAAASGIATGTIYNYYSAKDEIVYAVMLEDWKRTLDGMDADIASAAGIASASSADIDGYAIGAGDGGRVRGLEPIFWRLRNFTATYSEVWRRMAMMPVREKSPVVKCYDRSLFIRDLSLRIRRVLYSGPYDAEDDFGTDFVARIFGLYVMDANFDYSKLDRVLGRIF